MYLQSMRPCHKQTILSLERWMNPTTEAEDDDDDEDDDELTRCNKSKSINGIFGFHFSHYSQASSLRATIDNLCPIRNLSDCLIVASAVCTIESATIARIVETLWEQCTCCHSSSESKNRVN